MLQNVRLNTYFQIKEHVKGIYNSLSQTKLTERKIVESNFKDNMRKDEEEYANRPLEEPEKLENEIPHEKLVQPEEKKEKFLNMLFNTTEFSTKRTTAQVTIRPEILKELKEMVSLCIF